MRGTFFPAVGESDDRDGRRVIVLVEDDPLVRGVVAEVLRDAEFDVEEASSIREAVTAFRKQSDVLVLLTDLHVTGERSGLKLARAVHRRWPSISIILMSAWERPGSDELPPNSVFIPKPCVVARLVAEVRAAADRARSLSSVDRRDALHNENAE
jgi:DNA-binding response OmpR family regulator